MRIVGIVPTVVKHFLQNNCGLMAPAIVVDVYLPPMSQLRLPALEVLRRNVAMLLDVRKESQTAMAFALNKPKSWINKFLNERRAIQLRDLNRIADYFGLEAYELLQPGLTSATERRVNPDRRSGQERRVGHMRRKLLQLTTLLNKLPTSSTGTLGHVESSTALRGGTATDSISLDDLLQLQRELPALIAALKSRGRATPTRPAVAAPRPDDREPRPAAASHPRKR